MRGEVEDARGSDGASEDGSAKAVVGFAHGADGGVDLPAVSGDVDVVMAIPGPGFGDEDEAGASVAEALLEEVASVAGDEVGGGGGVAVVNDTDVVAPAGVELAEGLVEVVEGSVVVDQELGVESEVGCDGGVPADFGFGNGEDCGNRRWREFDDGDEGRLTRGEVGDGAERRGIEAFGAACGVMDGEENGGEGGRREHRFGGKGRHG